MPLYERPDRRELVKGTRLRFNKGQLNKTVIELTKVHEPWGHWKNVGPNAGRRGDGRGRPTRSPLDQLATETIVVRLARGLRVRTQSPGVTPIGGEHGPVERMLDEARGSQLLPYLQPIHDALPELGSVAVEVPVSTRPLGPHAEPKTRRPPDFTKAEPVPEPGKDEPMPEPPATTPDPAPRPVRRKMRHSRHSIGALIDEMNTRGVTIDAIEQYALSNGVGGLADALKWPRSQVLRVRQHFGTQPDTLVSRSRGQTSSKPPLPDGFDLFGDWSRTPDQPLPPEAKAAAAPYTSMLTAPPAPTEDLRQEAQRGAALDIGDDEVIIVLKARLQRLRRDRESLALDVSAKVEEYRDRLIREAGGDIDNKIAKAELALEAYEED